MTSSTDGTAADLFCPRYRMADRPDLYMWDSMEGTPGSASSDIPHHMDNNTDRGSETSWESHLKSWPINRPPLAHTGPHGSHGPSLFPSHPAHSQPSTPAPPRAHPDGLSGNPMGAGSGGMPGTPTPTSVSNATSPLVVPQPMKARTIKTYHCRMCDQEFHNKSEMTRHSKDVHGMEEKGHKCQKCFKSFPTSQQLAQHSLVHSNIRKFHCQYCDKTFKQLSHVQQHQRIHTGERPYKCTVESCGKAFAQLANLQQHLKNHDVRSSASDKKPYSCSTCDRRFATEASLNHHVTKLHSSLARPHDLICQVCEKHCSDEEKFFKHIHKYHPEYWRVFSGGRPLSDFIGHHEPRRREKPFHCEICHKRYSHETGYLKHLATHPESDPALRQQLWSCPVCHKVFTKESYLLRHMEMKLDDEHAAELVILKKKLKIGTEKPMPAAQASATLSSAMIMSGQRNLGEGTSREYGLQHDLQSAGRQDIGRQVPGQRPASSPQRGPRLDSIGGAAYSQDNKPCAMDVHGAADGLKFSPLHHDALQSPPPHQMSAADYQAVPATVGSPRASASSSPSTPCQRHAHPLLASAIEKLATAQPRSLSRSGEPFSNARNSGEESSPYRQAGNDSNLPKDMTMRDASRADDAGGGGQLRRSNSDGAFAGRESFGHLGGQDNLEYGRPPSQAPSYSRSPDNSYSPSSAYLSAPQGGLGNSPGFRPAVHGMIPPSYLPPSLHSAPYSTAAVPVANPYLSPGAELSNRDVATALQHLARTASSSLYNNR